MKRYINENGEFAPGNIMLDGALVMNPTEELLSKAGYHEYVEPAKTLTDYKADKIAEIEAYDASGAVNGFKLGGVEMWLSFDERARIRQSIDAYRNTGRTEMTKWFDGKAFTYPLDTWQSMLDRLSVYASEALNITEQHRAAIAALATVDEVNAYDITKGYPDKLVFL